MREANFGKDFSGIERVGANLACELNVLERRQVLHKVVELEHEADVVTAVIRELLLVKRAHLATVEHNRARRAGIHAAEHVQKRGLTRARRPDHDDELAFFDGKRHTVDSGDLNLAHLIDFANIAELDKRHADSSKYRRLSHYSETSPLNALEVGQEQRIAGVKKEKAPGQITWGLLAGVKRSEIGL